jgi:ubiquinone/menaquinone biosynthesis C-methylase UbiE
MAATSTGTTRLTTFYGEMTSLDRVLKYLTREGVDVEHLQARDLYERNLDCQNLGAYEMLDVIAAAVAEREAPQRDDQVLDVGCGMGGPGRFLTDRFGCSVTGIDLLPLRIETAQELTTRTGLAERIAYRVASAIDVPAGDASFAQAWMLDVSIHVPDKPALFTELARVLRPGGLLVIHDQTGPLPRAMAPVTREAPFIAPSLPQLIRYVEGAGLRVLDWRDTSPRVLAYWREIKASQEQRAAAAAADGNVPSWRKRMLAMADAYITTLAELGGRTGILIATRT